MFFWSDELFRLFGLDPKKDSADFRMLLEMVDPDDKSMLRKAIDETLGKKKPFSIEYRLTLPDGAPRTIHAQAELIRDEAGDPVILNGTCQDITERKRQEQALAESQASYRNLFNSSSDGIFIIDLDGNFIDANRTAYERLGYTQEELLALHITKLDHPSFASHVPERLRQIREQGIVVFESGHMRKDGSVMPVEVSSRLLEYKGKQVFFSVIRDITERKEAEEALRLTRFTVDNAADAVYWMDSSARIVDVNEAACSMLGYTAGSCSISPCWT
jgi:two-component system cell cycle sensor histidine kinase/response regulator CckA